MKRFIAFGGTLLAVAVLSSAAIADTFFSGTIGVDGQIAGGTNVPAANLVQGSGGVAYNNLWTGGAPGSFNNPAPPGTFKIAATGFFPVIAARTGVTNLSLNTGNRFVAVYAFEGAGSAAGGNFLGDFDPSAVVPGSTFADGTAHGIVNIYNFGATNPGLSDVDPTTWVPGAGTFLENINSSANLVAQLRITNRADAYLLGPPGAPTTVLPALTGNTPVNTLPLDPNSATLRINGDIKFVLNPDLIGTGGDALNFLFNDPAVMSAFGDLLGPVITPDPPGTSEQTDVRRPSDGALVNAFDLFTAVEQLVFDPAQQAQPQPSDADIANLNVLFGALLDMLFADDNFQTAGDHLFSDQAGLTGNAYNIFQNLFTGDDVARFGTAAAIPGAQFQQVVEPEPATVAIWVVVGMIGVAAVIKLKRPRIAVA